MKKSYFTRERLIGSRAFYRRTVEVLLPVIVQNTISNVVSLLDNVMIGQIGTQPMSAVAIVNQLMFVYNLCIFGGLAGAGIFASQFVGAGDDDGVRSCFRIKVLLGAVMLLAGSAVFVLFGRPLANTYLTGEADTAAAAETLEYAMEYLRVMLIGLLPFTLSQVYASTLR